MRGICVRESALRMSASARGTHASLPSWATTCGVKLRELMKSALADWRAETLDELLPGE